MSTIKHLKGHAWLISKRAIVFSSNTWVMRHNEPEDLTIQTIYCSDTLLLMTILLIMDSIMSKGENILLFHPTPSIFNTVIPDLQVNNKIKEEGFRFQTFVPRYVLPLIHIMMLSISITIISPLSPDTLTKPRSILSLDWKRPLLSQRTAGSFLFLLRVQTSINAGTECDFVTSGRRNSKVKTRFIGNLSENIYLLEVTHHCGFKERWCQPLWLLLKSVWLWLNWG